MHDICLFACLFMENLPSFSGYLSFLYVSMILCNSLILFCLVCYYSSILLCMIVVFLHVFSRITSLVFSAYQSFLSFPMTLHVFPWNTSLDFFAYLSSSCFPILFFLCVCLFLHFLLCECIRVVSLPNFA